MSQQSEPTRRGFISPLQKAQAGKIGGGKNTSDQAREQQRVEPTPTPPTPITPEPAQAQKPDRKATHFQQTIWIPRSLKRRLTLQVAREDTDISSLFTRLLEEYLDKAEG